MSNQVPYIIQGKNIVLFIENKPHTVSESHPRYTKIKDAILSGDWENVHKYVDIAGDLTAYAKGNVVIKNGEVMWKGKVFHNSLTKRMFNMLENDFPIEPLVAFMDNVMNNPSNRAVNELYEFLEKNSLPITPDGKFLAYKRVKLAGKKHEKFEANDYLDCYTGTIRNNVGDEPEMERNEVDDDYRRTCSYGLHFASLEYIEGSGYGGRDNPVVVLEIDPADVVSIPADYNRQKGRTCKYKVVGIHTEGSKIIEDEDTPVEDTKNLSKMTMSDAAKYTKKKLAKAGITYDRLRTTNSKTHRNNVNGVVCYFSKPEGSFADLPEVNKKLTKKAGLKLVLDGGNMYIVKA